MKAGKSGLILLLIVPFFLNDSALTAQDDAKKINAIQISAGIELADEPAIVIGGIRLTLGQAIQQAIKQNHDIIAGSYDAAMSDTYYEQFQKKYSIFLNAEGGYKYQKYPDSSAILTGEKTTTWDANAAVAKMFSSGTTVAGGVSHTYTEKTMPDDPALAAFADMLGPASYNMPVLFVSVQQDLLRNGFGYGERRQEQILKNAGVMQRDHIVSMSVIINKTRLDNSELQLRETQKVRNIIARRVALGQADSFNINYYNMLLAGAEAGVIAARQKYRDSLRNFLTTVNLSGDTVIEGTAVFSNKLPVMNGEAALKTAYEKRADYKNAVLAVENARLALEMYAGDAMPSLTAELKMSTMSQYETAAGAYGEAAALKYPSVESRLRMTYPLDDSEQRINERNARFKLKQARINLDKTERTVRDDIYSKLEAVETSYELYQKAGDANRQAAAFYNKMLQSLQRGRLSTADVKNGLDAMLNSRQNELTALVYFNAAILQFEVAKNELFDKYQIKADDYIPKDKK
jgi:outer membrane protein TolC